MQVTEWFANHYKDFGTTLEFVNDHTDEGNQFVKGFSGVGGILRWKMASEEEEADYVLDDDMEAFEDTDNMEDLF